VLLAQWEQLTRTLDGKGEIEHAGDGAPFLDIGYAWTQQLFVGLMLAGEQTPYWPSLR
jgi:hypothetical protein